LKRETTSARRKAKIKASNRQRSLEKAPRQPEEEKNNASHQQCPQREATTSARRSERKKKVKSREAKEKRNKGPICVCVFCVA